jgi:hypothetical protein|tara:strand:+ start:2213 stop:2398 length:186 start_codon:yes stop_codon:yes gene_type:complete
MSLTDLLLFLILVTLATYTFMPWEGISKGSWNTLIKYWIGFLLFFGLIIITLFEINLLAKP